jgi:YHS domain-containing protein
MKIIICLLAIVSLTYTGAFSQQATSRPNNLNASGVAIDGYDPVSYFVSRKAIEGKKEFSFAHEGATYYFTSKANHDAFQSNPTKYEPQYGGWCAFAMGDSGTEVEVDPETFKIIDGKLYLFYNKFFNNTLNSWNKDEANLKAKADKNWQHLLK